MMRPLFCLAARTVGMVALLGQASLIAPSQAAAQGATSVSSARLSLEGHTAAVNCVAFSPDGRVVLSASNDGTIRMWDATTGLEVRRMTVAQGRAAVQVFFVAEGRQALSLSISRNRQRDRAAMAVELWDLQSGKELRTFAGADADRIALLPDGRCFVGGNVRRLTDQRPVAQLQVYKIDTGELVRTFDTLPVNAGFTVIDALKVTTDAKEVLVSSDRTVDCYDLQSGMARQPRLETPGTKRAILGGDLAFGPKGDFVLSTGGGELHLWGYPSWRRFASTGTDAAALICSAVSADGLRGAAGGGSRNSENVIRLFDLSRTIAALRQQSAKPLKLSEMRLFQGHVAPVLDCCFAPDGKRLASASADKSVRIWDVETGVQLARCGAWQEWLTWDVPCGDRYLVRGGFKDHSVWLWDKRRRKEVRRFLGHTEPVTCVAASPDGRWACSGGLDRDIRVWDTETGKQLQQLSGHRTGVRRLVASPDGRRLLSIGIDGVHFCWDIASGKEIWRWAGDQHPLDGASCFAPNSEQVLCADVSGAVHLWNVQSAKRIRTIKLDGGEVYGLAFSPAGDRFLASALRFPMPQLFDVVTGRNLGKDGLSAAWVSTASQSFRRPPQASGTIKILVPR